jgi:hypothetical protein
MAYFGWLSFAGTELINNERASTYAALAGIDLRCDVPDLAASLGDDPYVDPVTDDAAWIDPSLPESGRFYGVAGLEFVGLQRSTSARSWSELLGDGGVPGGSRRASIEFEVRAVMVGVDEPAMSYGLAWLDAALRGSSCTTSCEGDELCLYAARPTRPRLLVPGDGECVDTGGDPDTTWDPLLGNDVAPGGDALVRNLYRVATIEGPEVTARRFVPGGAIWNVRWLVRVGTPWLFSSPRLVARREGSGTNPAFYTDTVPDYDPWSWRDACPDTVSCLDEDPWCTVPVLPPLTAPAPPDPCFPNDPRNNPPDEPTRHRFSAGRIVFAIPRGTGGDWFDKVPVIRLFSGNLPAQRIIVRWYDNPRAEVCGGGLDPCNSCAEINLVWLPRSSLLTLDGRVQAATVDCPGGVIQEPRLYGPSGGPLTWPVFECSAPLCCEVIMDSATVAENSWIDVSMVQRQGIA